MLNRLTEQTHGITWVSPKSLINTQKFASKNLFKTGRVLAKKGGAYQSAFKGRGMEFEESRIYQPGDDIRNMDWRVTARTGKPHSKIFCEEKERPILLWLDLNPSMMFATRNKFKAVIAAELASVIGWSATKNNDKVGALLFSPQQHIELKPKQGKVAVMNFIRHCCQHQAWQTSANNITNANHNISAISRLQKVTHPGSLIFMLSDFKNLNDTSYLQMATVARSNSIVLIKITDPLDSELPPAGNYRVSDGNNEYSLNTANKKYRQQYQQTYIKNDEKLEKFCRLQNIHKIDITTLDNAIEILKNNLGVHSHPKNQNNKFKNAAT